MKKQLINILKFALFVGIGVVILLLVYRYQNEAYMAECELRGIPEADCSLLDKVISDFRGANYFWILLVLIAFTVSNISRAIRWNMLLKPFWASELAALRPCFISGTATSNLRSFCRSFHNQALQITSFEPQTVQYLKAADLSLPSQLPERRWMQARNLCSLLCGQELLRFVHTQTPFISGMPWHIQV